MQCRALQKRPSDCKEDFRFAQIIGFTGRKLKDEI